MMMGLDVTTTLLFITVLILTAFLTLRYRSDLPGPTSWPIIGNIFIYISMERSCSFIPWMTTLAKKYGPVFRLFLGPYEVVYVCDHSNIRKILKENGQDFVDRPSWLPSIQRSRKFKGGIGVLWANGDFWKNMRRFAMSSMRDFGVGKTSLEEKIMEEAENIIEVFEKSNGKSVSNVHEIMTKASCNIIHHIIFGFRYKHDSPELIELVKNFKKLFNGPGGLSVFSAFPILGSILSARHMKPRRQGMSSVSKYLSEQIQEHKNSFDETNIRDFVDLYIKSEKLKTNSEENTSAKGELFSVILDLFIAGTETTSTTLDWAVLHMIANQDIQRKCQDEITKVVGSGRMVKTSDRHKLQYIEATLMETQRLGNTVPNSLPHMATRDTTIGGYKIPKGTIVNAITSLAHLDKSLWKNPEKFDPTRFLDANGDIVKNDVLMPFGAGPRVCLGESLARTELFIIFSNLLQRFTLTKGEDKDILSFEGISQITTLAPPYRLRAVLR